MIVTCGQCHTQFRLDDTRVGPGGLRVRCSLCKHSFVVEPSAAPPEEQRIHALAGEALAPPVTADLGSPPDALESLEQDWEFNDEGFDEEQTQPAQALSPPPRTREVTQRAVDELIDFDPDGDAPPLAPDLAEPDDLGNPDSWDFFAGAAATAPRQAPLPEEQAGEKPAAAAPRTDAPLAVAPPDVSRATAPRWLVRAASAAGWVLVLAIVAAGLEGGLGLRAPQGAQGRAGAPPLQELAGLELQVEASRFVENVFAGPVYVVSGTLRNRRDGPAVGALLELRTHDAQGEPLPGSAPLGPPLSPAELREWRPERLREVQREGAERLARVPLGPGERWLFDAVLLDVPAAAAGFVIGATPGGAAGDALRPGASPP